MGKALKWIGIVVLIPVVLVFILGVLLYVPPVQNWAVQKVAAYASEQTGMDISVGHVRLEFPLNLGVEDVRVLQPNDSLPQKKDTVADIKKAVVDIQLLPLFRKKVEIDKLELSTVKLNTTDFIEAARVRGTVGRLALESHGIDLSAETLRVNTATLADADLDVALADSVPPDTTESQNRWKIAVDQLAVSGSRVKVHLPGDTLNVEAHLGNTQVKDGFFDLGEGLYRVGHLEMKEGALNYDNRYEKPVKGLDTNHLALTGLSAVVDSLTYKDPQLNLNVRHLSFKEKSGLELKDLSGAVAMDDKRLRLPEMTLKTAESELTTSLDLDLNTFDVKSPGSMDVTLHGSFGKQDLMRFMGDMPSAFRQRWPNYPLRVDGVVRGNMERLQFTGLRLQLPSAFKATATGFAEHLDDLSRLKADVQLDAQATDVGFVKELLDADLRKELNIPRNVSLKGRFKADGSRYAARFTASEGGGSVRGEVALDADRMAYQAKLQASNLQLQHFLPRQGLSPFSGVVDATGVGTDFLSPQTRLKAKARIDKFRYAGYDLSGMVADATVQNGRAHAVVDSKNALLHGRLTLDALTNTKNIRTTVGADLKTLDLYRLGITHEPFTVALCGHVDVGTDMKDFYSVQGLVSDVSVVNRGQTFRIEDLALDILTRRDTTHAVVDCGDFHLKANARGGYAQLLKQADRVSAELQRQLKNRYIDQVRLRDNLPEGHIYLSTGRQNFLARMAQYWGYDLKSLVCDMASSPVSGLNGQLHVDSLIVDSIQLDTINLAFRSDADHISYQAMVRNNEKNPQYVFKALFDGTLEGNGTQLTARLYDEHDQLGVGLGLAAAMEEKGIRIRSHGMDPVLGYKVFLVNPDNYVFLGDDQRLSAQVQLKADDGTGVQIYTNDENQEALQDVTLSLHRFDLEKVLSVLPYTPSVSGVLNGDYHVIQTENDLSVSSNMSIDRLVYEHCPIGNIATEFVYMPKADGSHYVDGILLSEGSEVATIQGTYRSEGDGHLDATLGLERMPLHVINGFIPDQIVGLKGYGEGQLTIKGSLSKPDVNGEVFLDSAYLVSVPYGIEMRFDNDPVTISNSHLLFENFQMYAYNDSPLMVSGYYDFSNLDRMYMDVRMRARDFQLINAKENPRSEAYGKAFVNFFARMQGPVDNLQMRGKLDVLGSTDMTYILRDSPLTTDNQLEELVRFTNFADSVEEVVTRPPLTGFDMDLSMSIDENAHILCALNADQSNYVDLVGGGDLRMLYNTSDNLRLTGRYTLSNGEMKYSLPVIPLKTFTIQDGSYIEFLGDAMNPTLNITATEQTKAAVSTDGGNGRTVTFDCGVVITKTLQDMGLQFIIDAPEDMTIHNELQTMSAEERGKLAVTMLTTGMYLADGNTTGFSMNNALSAFLNSQINSISGNALRTLDLSVGMDNTTTASGQLHTDYSFKFAKRFWNNRLRVVVGGKVSTGAEIENQNNTFFDNVTFEYRLNQNSNKYLKLFYDRDSYDWLEGDVGEFGAGFMWKRKLQHFRDIFRLRGDSQQLPAAPQRSDSIKTNANETKK